MLSPNRTKTLPCLHAYQNHDDSDARRGYGHDGADDVLHVLLIVAS